jgi:DNA-binding LacI/PurR family transcriptional regulator
MIERYSKYERLASGLREKILRDKYKPGQRFASEHDLVRQTGLSRTSIRKAVDQLVSEGLIERQAGRGIFVAPRPKEYLYIQLVVPNLAYDQCAKISRGAQRGGEQWGAKVNLHDAHRSTRDELDAVRSLPEQTICGALVMGFPNEEFCETLYELKRKKFPFVLLDQAPTGLNVPSVTVDNRAGGYAIGRGLIEKGHKRIGYIGALFANTVQDRLAGVRDAVMDAGIAFDRSLVRSLEIPGRDPLGDYRSAIAQATMELMRLPDRPTAICYGDDMPAAYGLRVLQENGVSVPGDVSVVGFDDNILCELVTPTLSTVRQPSEQMGAEAMRLLLDVIENPDRPPEGKVLPVEWIPRDSIGPAKEVS